MELTLKQVVDNVIAKGAGSTLFGGKQMRGPLRTAEFIHEVMIGVAIELTDQLPIMFEIERKRHAQLQTFYRNYGNKGKYTDSYGWSKSGDNKMDFSFSPTFFNYFQRIIAPFLGGKIKGWDDENSKIWKYVKRLIISGDKVKITRLQQNIKHQILKEAKKRIQVGYGTNTSNTIETETNTTGSL